MTTFLIWSMLVLATVAAVLYGLWQRSKVKREIEWRKTITESLAAQGRAVDALIDGLGKEEEVRNENSDDPDRDHFGRL